MMRNINSGPSCRIFSSIRVSPSLTGHQQCYTVKQLPEKHLLCGLRVIPSPFLDHIFEHSTTQAELFTTFQREYIDDFIQGENISLIAYGGNQTGKSHTLFGPGMKVCDSEEMYGILPRVATYLYAQSHEWLVTVSAYEVGHRTQIRDLLNPGSTSSFYLGQDNVTGLMTLKNLKKEVCQSANELFFFLQVAMTNRETRGQSHINHCVVLLELTQPFMRGKEVVKKTSTALFAEMACVNDIFLDSNGTQVVQNVGDVLLRYLAMTISGPLEPDILIRCPDIALFRVLEPCFSGLMKTLVLCCICDDQLARGIDDMFVLIYVWNMKNNVHQSYLQSWAGTNESWKTDRPASPPLDDLNHSTSIAPEDTKGPQPHLECIEEVTESEEEIASSDEDMSESQKWYGSEPAEGDCLSESDFSDDLENACLQFDLFVDKLVDSFKSKSTFRPPPKDRSHTPLASRRGGLTSLLSSDTVKESDFPKEIPPVKIPERNSSYSASCGAKSDRATIKWKKGGEKPLCAEGELQALMRRASISTLPAPQSREPEEGERAQLLLDVKATRSARDQFCQAKLALDYQVKEKTANCEELKEFMLAEEMIEVCDLSIELTNHRLMRDAAATTGYKVLAETATGKLAESRLENVKLDEAHYLLKKMMQKIVDLRESGKQMEEQLADAEAKTESYKARMYTQMRDMVAMRAQLSPETLPLTTLGPCVALPQPQGEHSSSIPAQNLRQLQARVRSQPPTRVTRDRRKLIIQKTRPDD